MRLKVGTLNVCLKGESLGVHCNTLSGYAPIVLASSVVLEPAGVSSFTCY
jgi:hypothetical protein